MFRLQRLIFYSTINVRKPKSVKIVHIVNILFATRCKYLGGWLVNKLSISSTLFLQIWFLSYKEYLVIKKNPHFVNLGLKSEHYIFYYRAFFFWRSPRPSSHLKIIYCRIVCVRFCLFIHVTLFILIQERIWYISQPQDFQPPFFITLHLTKLSLKCLYVQSPENLWGQ